VAFLNAIDAIDAYSQIKLSYRLKSCINPTRLYNNKDEYPVPKGIGNYIRPIPKAILLTFKIKYDKPNGGQA